ncbi:unnamed protein product [Urochloa decumbens]|uniref:diphthine methyl ester synthase n=1 Tax=Urochloa decumbens TaxID=240449 RepID=A0ABC8YB97_9POAL
MLYVVGLGLGDERGVTVRGLDAVRRCARVYMEAHTALLALAVDDHPSSRLAKLVRSRSFALPTRRSLKQHLRCFIALQEKLYGKEVIVAGREMVDGEDRSDRILREATGADVAFLVIGHPFGSDEPSGKTTHTDLVLRAKKLGVGVKVIDSASVLNAVGACGLQLHRYGEAIAVPFFTETCKRDHFYQAIVNNRWLGLHTLCLLDFTPQELSSYLCG